MNTQDVANKLIQLCREGKNVDAVDELYANDIVSYEPKGSDMEITEGKAAVINKNKLWFDMVEEIHGVTISEPIVSGNFFACAMDIDVTYKGMGRDTMNEICVYEVEDGKIISERFHYSMQQA
ncbi:MAG: nuclear transport factor 2 family protein [Mucilaginibacter sp.]|uniref:nuclear transport factor 2 family protein n=1 Tax=Mucilaginibacter sp. TaxID=1882438 RepID=UPI0031B00219